MFSDAKNLRPTLGILVARSLSGKAQTVWLKPGLSDIPESKVFAFVEQAPGILLT